MVHGFLGLIVAACAQLTNVVTCPQLAFTARAQPPWPWWGNYMPAVELGTLAPLCTLPCYGADLVRAPYPQARSLPSPGLASTRQAGRANPVNTNHGLATRRPQWGPSDGSLGH